MVIQKRVVQCISADFSFCPATKSPLTILGEWLKIRVFNGRLDLTSHYRARGWGEIRACVFFLAEMKYTHNLVG